MLTMLACAQDWTAIRRAFSPPGGGEWPSYVDEEGDEVADEEGTAGGNLLGGAAMKLRPDGSVSFRVLPGDKIDSDKQHYIDGLRLRAGSGLSNYNPLLSIISQGNLNGQGLFSSKEAEGGAPRLAVLDHIHSTDHALTARTAEDNTIVSKCMTRLLGEQCERRSYASPSSTSHKTSSQPANNCALAITAGGLLGSPSLMLQTGVAAVLCASQCCALAFVPLKSPRTTRLTRRLRP